MVGQSDPFAGQDLLDADDCRTMVCKGLALTVKPIVVEQSYRSPIAVVWQAITNPRLMPQWFFEPIEEFEPRVGFETRFAVHADGMEFVHLWKVTEVIPEERIVYNWRYAGFPGDSTVTWALEAVAEGTRLKLTHTVLEEFPQDIPAFRRESGVAGWTYFIKESLNAFLEELEE